MNFYDRDRVEVGFETMGGKLIVRRSGELYEMEFPAYRLQKADITEEIIDVSGAVLEEAYLGRNLLCVFEDEDVVRSMEPDMEKVLKLPGLLFHVTAPCKTGAFDCVSRSFAPKLGVAEAPVCGSGHCHIIPCWAEKSGKDTITAYQASPRGGVLYCQEEGPKVKMSGKAVLYAKSEIFAC